MCDSDRKFLFASIEMSGPTHDSVAWKHTSLCKKLDQGLLEAKYWIAADNAYSASQYLVTPFAGTRLPQPQDTFNFYLSNMRILIECTFGLFVARWGFLWRASCFSVRNTITIVMALVCLNIFCIDCRCPLEIVPPASD